MEMFEKFKASSIMTSKIVGGNTTNEDEEIITTLGTITNEGD
ncbi:hypothetical protein [uncultured Kordia sp.]|nr:hypothetical protein [uncultured Kordia sp.]